MIEYDRPAIMAEICEHIASGKGLPEICKAEGMPSRSTVHKWLEGDAGLSDMYVRARERQAEYFADDLIRIADEATDAQLARLQVDARKWAAAKLSPRKYGDKLDLNHGGHVKVEEVRRVIVDPRNTDS